MIPALAMQTRAKTNVKLPVIFIIFGLVSFLVAQIILLFNTDILSGEFVRLPSLWMATHFLLLGFATMIAMGVMYQLVPGQLQAPIFSEKLGFIQLAVTIVGCFSFPILLGLNSDLAMYGTIVVVIGLSLFLIQMALTFAKKKILTIVDGFVILALFCLLLTILAGVFLVWNITMSSVAVTQAIFNSHLTFGIIGWFTVLIFGFSYKLIPMFSLSREYSNKYIKFVFFIYIAGLLLMIVSFWFTLSSMQAVGLFLLLLGFSFFVLDVRGILKSRLQKKLDLPLSFAILAIYFALTVHCFVVILSIFQISSPSVWTGLIFFYIVGWIVFSILGYLLKIVPLLWTAHLNSKANSRQGVKQPVATLMVNEKQTMVLYSLFIIGLIGVFIGIVSQIGMILFIFQLIFVIAAIGYVLSVVRIFYV